MGSGGGEGFDAAEFAAFGASTDARTRGEQLDEGLKVDLAGRSALVLGGQTGGPGGADHLASLEEAGLDWWSEGLWAPGRDVDAALARVSAGPLP